MALSGVNRLGVEKALIDNLNLSKVETDNKTAFDNLFNSAISMYDQANELQNAAEQSEINFSLGYATSVHDLAVAQQKANIALQYTVKVTNKALEAYKELINMQI